MKLFFILPKNSFYWSRYLDIYMSAMKIKSYQGVRLACIDIPDCVLIFSTVILAFINFLLSYL